MKKIRIKKMRNKELLLFIKNYEQEKAKKIFRSCVLLLVYLNLPYLASFSTLSSMGVISLTVLNLTVIVTGIFIIYIYPLTVSRYSYLQKVFPLISEDFHTSIKNAHLYCQKATNYKKYQLPPGIWGLMAKIEIDCKIEESLYIAEQHEKRSQAMLEDIHLIKRTFNIIG
jgi:hypothetical protein